MGVRVPIGGFFAALEPDPARREDLSQRLCAAGADDLKAVEGGGPLLAAWREFPGQGLWVGKDSAAAYDLDLVNEAELLGLVGLPPEADSGELLWSLYRQLGEAFLDRLRGAFGFALWDGREERLLVVTDPYGIRPVLHAGAGEGVVAASRIRHLLLHPGVGRELDPEAIYHYLYFSAIPSPVSIYRSVRKLEPGRLLSCSGGRTELRTHYDIRYRPDESWGESHWRSAIPSEVRRAVGRSVPPSARKETGCFLSGGTDSSSVAGYATEVAGVPARTFSIGFDEPGYNELDFAHVASRHFGTEQHEYFVTPEDVLALVEALPDLYDEPFGNSSVIPTYYCARMAAENGVGTLLAGDGGDEIFGGNERYVTNLIFERYKQLPGFVRRGVLEPILSALPAAGALHKARRYVRRANIPNPDRFFSYNLLYETPSSEVFRPEFLAEVDAGCFLRLARAHYDRAAPAHDTDRLLYLDMKLTITDNDLRKVTQMTEAAGVRVRYPLLDRDLVDFTATIPPTLKAKPGRNRYIFKRAMEAFLPREIIEKTKHGFGLPIAPWFKRDPRLSQLLNDTLFSPETRVTNWVNPGFLQGMKAGFEGDGVSYYGANFWVMLMLEMWMRAAERRG